MSESDAPAGRRPGFTDTFCELHAAVRRTRNCYLRHCTCCTVKNIRISTDILWRVFCILTEPVSFTFISVNRRNNEARICSVKIWKTCHKIYVDMRIFFYSVRLQICLQLCLNIILPEFTIQGSLGSECPESVWFKSVRLKSIDTGCTPRCVTMSTGQVSLASLRSR